MSEPGNATETAHAMERALEISCKMLTAAHEQDWDGLEKLHTDRDAVLRSALVMPTSQRAAKALIEHIHRIRDINERVASLAEAARDTCGERMRHIRLGRRASTTYQYLGG